MSDSTREAMPSSFDLVIGGERRPAADGATFELTGTRHRRAAHHGRPGRCG
ncbi:MAG: hypothetical protein M5U19_02415 [Microthrixaceae bacterium]|nr:hypothetical protein [Microthrixaceae bacterium]